MGHQAQWNGKAPRLDVRRMPLGAGSLSMQRHMMTSYIIHASNQRTRLHAKAFPMTDYFCWLRFSRCGDLEHIQPSFAEKTILDLAAYFIGKKATHQT